MWDRYWKDSLADSGMTGLEPVRPAAWHVPITQLIDPDILEKRVGAEQVQEIADILVGI